MIDKEKLKILLLQGKTYQRIGNIFGVSRQRIDQFVSRNFPELHTRKPGSLKKPREIENTIAQILIAKGHSVGVMTRKVGYDLLVDGYIRVKIYYRSNRITGSYIQFHHSKTIVNNFYSNDCEVIIIALKTDEEIDYYMLTGKAKSFSLATHPKYASKNQLNRKNRWDIFDKK